MNRYSKVVILALIAIIVGNLMGSGNSIFSKYGFPNQNEGYDVYGMGLGNTGCGDFFRMNQGIAVNPALSTIANNVLFSTGLNMGLIDYEDVQGNSFRDTFFDFPYFSMQVPLDKHHLAFQFTSLMSGNLQSKTSGSSVIDGETYKVDTYENIYSYMYRADMMYAYKISNLSLGVGANYYLGNRKEKTTQDYIGIGPDIDTSEVNPGYDTYYEKSNTYQNPGFVAGLGLKYDKFSMGLSYHSSVDLKNTKKFNSILGSVEIPDDTFILPHIINAGLAFKITDVWKTSIDFRYSIWEDSDIIIDSQDTWRVGAGLAYQPLSGEEKFFKKFPLRVGYSLRVLPFKVNSSNVNENTYTCGVTFPIKTISSRLDFAYQLTQRGSIDNNDLEEYSHMFMIGISGFDIFQKTLKRNKPREIPKAEDLY
jgi:long-subunit fatty acid transport protein